METDNRYKFLLSGLFFMYLIMNGSASNTVPYVLAGALAIGFCLDFRWQAMRRKEWAMLRAAYGEYRVFLTLEDLMKREGLEARVKSAPEWNVVLLSSSRGLTKLEARGSGRRFVEAVMNAEDDFEQKRKAS